MAARMPKTQPVLEHSATIIAFPDASVVGHRSQPCLLGLVRGRARPG